MSVPGNASSSTSYPQPVSAETAEFLRGLERERRTACRALDRLPSLAPISPAQGARHRAELAAALGLARDDTPAAAIVR